MHELPEPLLNLARSLPYGHDAYFNVGTAKLVALNKLQAIRARPEGIARAVQLMADACYRDGGKRGPLKVRRLGRGFEIVDGNSTYAVAILAGWGDIPCEIVSGEAPHV